MIAGKSVATRITFDPCGGGNRSGAWPNSSLAPDTIAMSASRTDQQSGSALTQAVEEARLVLVGHVEIAVAHDAIEQIVHGFDRRVGDQTQGGLIEIDALLERRVFATVDER